MVSVGDALTNDVLTDMVRATTSAVPSATSV